MLVAKDWGWSPTALIREAKNPRKPHPADYAFAHAVKTIQEEHCPRCGVPIWHAYSTDSNVKFELDDVTCYACQFKEQEEAKMRDEPGVTRIVRVLPDDPETPLPDRSAFFEQMAKEQEQKEKLRAAKRT